MKTYEPLFKNLMMIAGAMIDGGRGPGLCPGVNFRRTRPWIQATGEWRAEGSSLDFALLLSRAEYS